MRNSTSHPALFFMVSALLLPFPCPSPTSSSIEGMGNGGLGLVHTSSSLLLLPSQTFPLLQCELSICHSSFWEYPPAPLCCSPEAVVWMTGCLLLHGPLLRLQGSTCSPGLLHRLQRHLCCSISSPCSSLTLTFTGLLLTLFSLSPGCTCSFLSSWNTFSQRQEEHG